LVHYLRPLILGTGFCAEFTRPALTDPGLQDMTAWVWTFMLFGVIGYALYSALIQRNRIGWCVLLFFGLLFPVSNLLIHLEVIGAERFLYLPSIGYGIALGLLIESIFWSKKSWAYAALIGLCLWYGWGAFERNKAWETEE